jgi:hypothetical protein
VRRDAFPRDLFGKILDLLKFSSEFLSRFHTNLHPTSDFITVYKQLLNYYRKKLYLFSHLFHSRPHHLQLLLKFLLPSFQVSQFFFTWGDFLATSPVRYPATFFTTATANIRDDFSTLLKFRLVHLISYPEAFPLVPNQARVS